ncbi:MAG: homoserine dehydrogenase, partial [bacterium]
VVTANKALIALHGNAIFHSAQKRGVMVAFEAAVAGGIPIIKALREGLAANRIEWLAGIINGTCNYILTQMDEADGDFDEVLREAQRLGYAEADPGFDIGGADAAHKLTILASIAFGIPLQFERVHVQGIAGVGAEDIAFARELGYRIKHLGIARRAADGIELRVHPTLIPARRLLANVNGVMNAILVHADAVGPTLHCGAGAGAEPTASSVVADLIDVVRAVTTDPQNRVPHLAFQPGSLASSPILPIDQVETAYYLRLSAINRPGVLAAITRIFGDSGISIDTILQKGRGRPNERVTIIMLTQRTRERNMNSALEQLGALDTIAGEIVHIRLEQLS